jgi:putative transposase
MREWPSLSHVKWECKYHVVIVPKYRKKVLYGRLRGEEVGKIIRQLCRQKEVELIEGHAMPDHVHLVLSVPPKYSIAMVLGYLKVKSAIHIHRKIHGIKQGFTGRHFWSRGYCVSTVGLDEEMIRAYVRDQEHQDKQEALLYPKPLAPFRGFPQATCYAGGHDFYFCCCGSSPRMRV